MIASEHCPPVSAESHDHKPVVESWHTYSGPVIQARRPLVASASTAAGPSGPPPFAVLWRPLGLLSLRVRRSDKNPPASGLGNARARAHRLPPPAIAWAAPQQARQDLLSACEDAAHGPYTSQLNKAWWRSGVQQTAGSRACQFASRQNLRIV